MRRFDIGPLIVAVGSLVLLVSLFMDWYAGETAWGAFEVADVLLAALAVAALLASLGMIAEEIGVLDGRWLPALVVSATVLVIAEILSPPPVVGGADPQEGAWVAFAAALGMLLGTVLSLGRVSFSFAIEGREPRRRVAAVDHRPPPTETDQAPVARRGEETSATEALPDEGGKTS
jgi:hypothetical protein